MKQNEVLCQCLRLASIGHTLRMTLSVGVGVGAVHTSGQGEVDGRQWRGAGEADWRKPEVTFDGFCLSACEGVQVLGKFSIFTSLTWLWLVLLSLDGELAELPR